MTDEEPSPAGEKPSGRAGRQPSPTLDLHLTLPIVDPVVRQATASGLDPVALIRSLAMSDETPLALLDSAGGSPQLARRHYLAWRPALWLRVKDGRVRLLTAGGETRAVSGDPFALVRAAAASAAAAAAAAPIPEARALFGLVAYDAARYLEALPDGTRDDLRLPDIDLFLPTRFLRHDRATGETLGVAWPLPRIVENCELPADEARARPDDRTKHLGAAAAKERRTAAEKAERRAAAADAAHVIAALGPSCVPASDVAPAADLPVYRSNFARVHYENVVGRTREYVFAGDIFQANLSQRLELLYSLESLHLYETLRAVNPSPFAGYLRFGEYELISSSPERLVELSPDGWAQTRPIAGTRPRGQADLSSSGDQAMTSDLNLDPKDRAEHIMLVDLERNDLGKVCDYGTVRVSELMVNEAYSHVIHIVSNVRGRLHPRRDAIDLLKAMFPGGTITGCPKVRCMEIIDELETVRRGAYTGSFGWLTPDALDMNIVIRTLVRVGDRLYLQAGGGIVADSVPEKEYFETLHKAQGMLRAVSASVIECVTASEGSAS